MKELRDQFEITAHPQNAGHGAGACPRLAAQAGFSGMDLADIEIAVGEAVTNAILYGSPTAASRIVIISGLQQTALSMWRSVIRGMASIPAMCVRGGRQDALGGRGIRLMRALMDRGGSALQRAGHDRPSVQKSSR